MDVVSRRKFLKSVAASAAALTLPGLTGKTLAQSGTPRPNFILIYSDDHGYADMGAQGVDYIPTGASATVPVAAFGMA